MSQVPTRKVDVRKKIKTAPDPEPADISSSKMKKQLKKTERGPTKKELREEIQTEVKIKQIKRDLKKGKISSEQAQRKKDKLSGENEVQVPSKKSATGNISAGKGKKSAGKGSKPAFKKVKKPRPIKTKVAKMLYTVENINSFLLEARSSENKNKATNMLLFIFKTFKKNSADLLAKIKILTSGKKVDTEGLSLRMAVMKHLFAFYDMKDEFYKNLFELISNGSLLSKYACDYLYSASFDSEEYDEHLNKICLELARVLEKTAQLPFDDYMDYIRDMDMMDDIQDFRLENDIEQNIDKDASSTEDKSSMSSRQDCFGEAQKILNPHNEEESTFTLQSLSDDAEIERLDRELGSFFSRGMVGIQDEEYASVLSACLESLIKHNYAVKIDDLIKILYFHQFEPVSNTFKHIAREYMSKFKEPSRIFKIFQMASMVTPNLYSLYNVFLSHCGGEFDHLRFMRCVLNFGHEDFVLNRINKDSFYRIYSSNLGEDFDSFMMSLLALETREDKLKELSRQVFKPEIKEAIRASLESLDMRKIKKAKVRPESSEESPHLG